MHALVDVETRIDKQAIRLIYGNAPAPDESDEARTFAENEAVALLVDRVKGGRVANDFVPLPFHIPISIAVGKVADDFSLSAVYTMPGDERGMVETFWKKAAATIKARGVIVTFNGRAFDMPVLEMAALRYGIPIFPQWFSEKYGGRYRYQIDWHMDLLDVLNNYGASRLYGGLDGILKVCGLPGKDEINGSMVQGMWERGEFEQIHDYCRRDVSARTYPLFLRMEHWQGRLSPERYAELTAPGEQK